MFLATGGAKTRVSLWSEARVLCSSRHTSGGSASTFYTFDAQGSVAQRYTATGSLVSSDLYDAFGKGTSTGGGDVFGYEGQVGYYTDTSTGLILCGHRFYDSAAGRFINRDPIGYAGGINLYGYTGNNASNKIDPSGFDCGPNPGFSIGGPYGITGGPGGLDIGGPDGITLGPGGLDIGGPDGITAGSDGTNPGSNYINAGGPYGISVGSEGFSAGGPDGIGVTPTSLNAGGPDGINIGGGPYYRGGTDMTARPGIDIKVDPNGMVYPGNKGLSINTNPYDPNVQSRGANEVVSYPPGISIVQQGKNPTHYVMAPAYSMPYTDYQNLLNQTVLKPFH